jgi:hypothetical protein
MKQIFLFAFALLQLGVMSAFTQSASSNLNYKGALRPGLVLPLMYKTDIAEQTILAKLKETGYKPQMKGNMFSKKNKQEGFYVFTGVQLPELANQKLDLYFKVDPLDGNNSLNSSISLLVSKGYDNFVSPETDSATFGASERFLNSFVAETADFQLQKQMDEQKKTLADTENKWQKIRTKQDETRNKISQLEADLKNMQQEELTLQQEVDKQRSSLKDLEVKRSSTQH